MASLPTISEILNALPQAHSPLAVALSILFEPSPILLSTLEPQVAKKLASTPITTYSELIDIALSIIKGWDKVLRSQFIAGHPRIGETKNLSSLSAKEQGAIPAVAPTPPEVLARLGHLNACYERQYPGLRYITFVNGRSRAAIAEEMEGVLGIEHSLSPDEPTVDGFEAVHVGKDEWAAELNRAVGDVGLIAKSRLKALDVE